jgi:hypothetical protein
MIHINQKIRDIFIQDGWKFAGATGARRRQADRPAEERPQTIFK